MLFTTLFSAISSLALVSATPVPEIQKRAVDYLSTAVRQTWTPLAHYASAAYCSETQISNWNCNDCKDIGGSNQILLVGGDNQLTTRYYVANNGSAIIVGIAGTNALSAVSWGVDMDATLTSPSSSDFPGGSGLRVHNGFYGAFKRQAAAIDPVVQAAVAAGTTTVYVTGHSQGASLTQLHATHLQKLLGSSATVYARAFAPARVGNQAWANYVDATLGERSQWLSNAVDIVTQVPSRLMGFVHSSNEIWITTMGGLIYRACSGQENANSLGLVGSYALGMGILNTPAHLGPWAGVTMGCL